MKKIDPDVFAKLMSLPDSARVDLLEFLGATPLGETQIKFLLSDLEASIRRNKNPSLGATN